MWLEIAYGALLLGDFLYHRFHHDDPPAATQRATFPVTAPGSPVPLVFGRCRVRQPVCGWVGTARSHFLDGDVDAIRFPHLTGFLYQLDVFLVLGIPMSSEGSLVHRMWAGEQGINVSTSPLDPNLGALTGNGTDVVFIDSQFGGGDGLHIATFGDVSFMNGNASQITTSGGFWTMPVSQFMIAEGVEPTLIPGYRDYLGVFLYGLDPDPEDHWIVGTSPSASGYSFEVSSYPSSSYAVQPGYECNPVDVIADILTGEFGKLGLDSSIIDATSFGAAGIVLYDEGNGYSRAVEEFTSAEDLIQEILKQIDAVLYEDPRDGKVKIKLVRQDYDPAACLEVNPSNCEELQSFSLSSWTGVPNIVRVTYNSRTALYQDDVVTAQNPANAVGQDGEIVEVALSFPGVCTSELAQAIADRELAAQSRPLARCTAIVDATFCETVPGDVVAITWPDYGISGAMFRVAGVSRGTLEDGKIKLSLVQEYFQVSRGAHIPVVTGAFPPSIGGLG